MKCCDVVVVGAGPYGLSAAAHLHAVNGLRVRVFGEPMSFWERHMPADMLLRSPWPGCHLSDPERAFRFDAYKDRSRESDLLPVPLQEFVAYGHWFRRSAVLEIDSRKIASVEAGASRFGLTLQDGEPFESRQVIIATGIANFVHRPGQFAGCPPQLVSHSSEHRDFSAFAGRRVVVIGGGQSALESAALLHEAGSEVEVLVRAPQLFWTWSRPWLRTFKPLSRLLFAPSDVGPPFVSHAVARPSLYRRLPRQVQDRWAARSIQPSVASWLKPRLKGVRITLGREVASVLPGSRQLTLKLNDGSERLAHHIVLATGYRVNISRYPFLSPVLLDGIHQVDGYPRLNHGFESSIAGLYFLGAPAAWSFGPLLRFVAGAEFAAHRVAERVLATISAANKVGTYERVEPTRV